MGRQVQISITDNGVGIAAGNVRKLFEPFFTTKPQGEGTGLGLYVCRSILQASGGDISVESAPGRTRFTVTLPLAEASLPPAAESLQTSA